MQQKTCGCGKAWTITYERTRDQQAAHEITCPDCGIHIAGLEKASFMKLTATREDEIEEGPNVFFPRRAARR